MLTKTQKLEVDFSFCNDWFDLMQHPPHGCYSARISPEKCREAKPTWIKEKIGVKPVQYKNYSK